MQLQLKLAGLLFVLFANIDNTQCQIFSQSDSWQAHWITAAESKSDINTWICFRKEVNMKAKSAVAIAKIAVDSKYWLWINGRQVIFEGGLKRGPNPTVTIELE
jgi:alpha-L-rhamnosidase